MEFHESPFVEFTLQLENGLFGLDFEWLVFKKRLDGEFAFQLLFGTDGMRYLGGVVGLTVGYFIKYRLDKRFVFVDRAAASASARLLQKQSAS